MKHSYYGSFTHSPFTVDHSHSPSRPAHGLRPSWHRLTLSCEGRSLWSSWHQHLSEEVGAGGGGRRSAAWRRLLAVPSTSPLVETCLPGKRRRRRKKRGKAQEWRHLTPAAAFNHWNALIWFELGEKQQQ